MLQKGELCNIKEMKRVKINILGLSEIRCKAQERYRQERVLLVKFAGRPLDLNKIEI